MVVQLNANQPAWKGFAGSSPVLSASPLVFDTYNFRNYFLLWKQTN